MDARTPRPRMENALEYFRHELSDAQFAWLQHEEGHAPGETCPLCKHYTARIEEAEKGIKEASYIPQ